MMIGSTEWKIAELERNLADLEEKFKALQEERAERAFELEDWEEEEILNILDDLANKAKDAEKEIEQLKKTA
jgi:chromosome segregation ATPase